MYCENLQALSISMIGMPVDFALQFMNPGIHMLYLLDTYVIHTYICEKRGGERLNDSPLFPVSQLIL